jgi:aminopeptidase N
MAATLALRSGHRNGVYTIALWYPKLAVYDESGWHLEQYRYLGEFYGDFADYIVELTVPASFAVGASGRLEFEVSGSVKKTLSFFADDVHDFAWVASARYQVKEFEWEGILIRGLYLNQDALAERGLNALEFYSEQFGPYAYPVFTIAQVEAGGGMEYPALIMIGTGSDREIAHEVAHQWWYAAVGNNEFDEAWLDEGFSAFSEERYLMEELGYAEEFTRSSLRFREPGEIVLQPASQYPSLSIYAAAVYTKGSGILWMLRGLLGKETFDGLLREYYKQFQLRNVTTSDFTALAEKVSQRELDWFFDEWLRTTKTLDFSVKEVRSTLQGEGRYQNTFTVSRAGEATMPVVIQLTNLNGEMQRIEWDGQETEKQFVMEGASPLQRVTIDPERTILEEVRSNNTALLGQAQLPRTLSPTLQASSRSSSKSAPGWPASPSPP